MFSSNHGCRPSLVENELGISGFQPFHKVRSESRSGGILFLVKNHLDAKTIEPYNPNENFEDLGIKIENATPKLDFLVCHKPPDTTSTQQDWDNIVNMVENESHCILLGDFNSHHQFWNCRNNYSNGIRLLNSINSKDLIIHNTATETRIDPRTGKSRILI